MSDSKIKEILSTLVYPNLDKNIVELKLVDKIEKKANQLNISLSISNDEVFANISSLIEQSELAKQFEIINVTKKQIVKKLVKLLWI